LKNEKINFAIHAFVGLSSIGYRPRLLKTSLECELMIFSKPYYCKLDLSIA